jgi:putative ubiquitin-RnfH superfamily antitoxin RatB of RatAB toxin-antitoxin module
MADAEGFQIEVRWIEPTSGIARTRLLSVSTSTLTLGMAIEQWRNRLENEEIGGWFSERDWSAIGLNGKRARPDMNITAQDRIDFTLPLRQEAMALRRERASLYKTQKRRAAR